MKGLQWKCSLLGLAVLLVFTVLAVCLVSAPPLVASADGYQLIVYDGGTTCHVVTKAVDEIGRNEYTHSNGVYTFVYHEGINLTIGSKTTTGEDIQWVQAVPAMNAVTGDTYYSVTGRINGSNHLFKIYVKQKSLSVEWDEDTLSCEYGQPVAPVVTLKDPLTDDVIVPALTGEIGFVDTNGDSPFTTQYVRTTGVGTYTIKPTIPADSNYRLAESTHAYTVEAYSGAISVEREEAEVTYNGAAVDAVALLGATVPEGYGVLCQYYTLDSSDVKTNRMLTGADTYHVRFCFDGTAGNYANYKAPASGWYAITVTKADVRLSATDVPLSFAFDSTRTADGFKTEIYAKRNTAYTIRDGAGNAIEYSPEDFTYSYRLTEEGGWGTDVPTDLGNYWVRIHFNGSLNYNPTDADSSADYPDLVLPFALTKATVNYYWYTLEQDADYGLSLAADALAGKYYFNNASFVAWANADADEDGVPDNQVTYSFSFEYSADTVAWAAYLPQEGASKPGYYRVKLYMDSALYCGETTDYITFHVNKVPLSKDNVTFAATSFVYGSNVDLGVGVEGITLEGGMWQIAYRQGGVAVSARDVGTYDVVLTLAGDAMYSGILTYTGHVTITPKHVEVTVWNYYVYYGDKFGTLKYGLRENGGLVYWPAGTVLAEDEESFLAGLTVQFTKKNDTLVSQLDSGFVVGERYPIVVTSASDNYDVEFAYDSGNLVVDPRPLRVNVTSQTGTFIIYEGAGFNPVISVETGTSDFITDDELSSIKAALSLSYKDSDGNDVEGKPTEVGTYTIQLVTASSTVLNNYRINYTPVTLTIKSLSLDTTDSSFRVSGRFGTNEVLKVEKVTTNRYNSAASSVLSGYSVAAVYEISNPMSATTGQITFRLAAPEKSRSVKVLYLEGDKWQEVDCTQEGSYLVFSQSTMAKTYLVCAKAELNWMLIGIIGGAVVVVILIVLVVLLAARAKRNKKLKDDASKQVAAPTARATASPDEEEELDSFIETFDASTVERELTPAERIALREREEKYQQYKARLARMRTSDRTLSEALSGLGVDKSADDDEIIRRMIEADEARAKQVEEDLKREQEEARRKEEEAKKVIILERSDEVLEQKTFAPTFVESDDDDIDI